MLIIINQYALFQYLIVFEGFTFKRFILSKDLKSIEHQDLSTSAEKIKNRIKNDSSQITSQEKRMSFLLNIRQVKIFKQ